MSDIIEEGNVQIMDDSDEADKGSAVLARMLDEFKFDPLAASIRVAKGEALTKDHPLLPILTDMFATWRKRITLGEAVGIDDIDRMEEKCNIGLTDSWVSPELRSKHIMDLLAYTIPKRKAVDHTHSGGIDHNVKPAPLTVKDMEAFDTMFKENY